MRSDRSTSWSNSLLGLCLTLLVLVWACAAPDRVTASTANSNRPTRSADLLVAFRLHRSSGATLATARRLGLEVDPTVRSQHLMRLRLGHRARAAGLSIDATLRALRQDPNVRIAEPDYPLHTSALPNDPRFPQLWGLHNTGLADGTPDADIDAPEAWEVTTGSPHVVVAVIDTGVDYNHPDLRDNILRDNAGNLVGWDFANDDANPMDDNGHGTHVAGTIGAEGNNGVGVVGVCPTVRIMPVKFLGADGSGSTANAIQAVDFAVSHGARVLNCSWGGGGQSELLLEALQRARAAGVLVVAAAGNESTNNDETPSYPASYNQFCDNVLSIAATDKRDALAAFSNFGRDTVDLCAPGVGIVSTLPGNSYGSYSGTSMATPHVSGVAALLLSRYPDLDLAQLRHRLISNADILPDLGPKVPARRLNAAQALVEDTIAPGAPSGLTATHLSAAGVLLSWSASGDDGPAGRASGYELRVSDHPITEASFADATAARWLPEPGVSGTPETSLLTLSTPGQRIYIALRAVDNVGNNSTLVVLPPLRVADGGPEVTAFEDHVEGNSRFSGTTPWAVTTEDSYGPGHSYTDSPRVPYALDTDTSLTQMSSVQLTGFVPVLHFQARTDLEAGFDFLYVEASTDEGATWTRLEIALTDTQEWSSYAVSLGRFYGHPVRVRFRLVSDDVVTAQGVWLDDITISGSILVPLATAVPSAPTDLQVASVSSTQVALSWSDRSDNETSFLVERRLGNGPYTRVGAVGADFTAFTDASVVANTLYAYRVRASNAAGASPATEAGTILTWPDPPPPPGLLRAVADLTSIQLTWHAASGAERYQVERSLQPGGPYTVIATVADTTYRDGAVNESTRYYYVVSSLGPGGESVNGNEAAAAAGVQPPDPPSQVRARAQSGQVQITWIPSTSNDVQANRVYRGLATGGPYTLLATITEKARYVDRRPGRGRYSYRVTAVNAGGLESIPSEDATVTVGALRGRKR